MVACGGGDEMSIINTDTGEVLVDEDLDYRAMDTPALGMRGISVA